MGVPAFFRWLTRKYPRVVSDVKEQEVEMIDNTEVPIDTSEANPNGMEFDNLYLDMNGIIHPCCHPEDKEAPPNEDEMIKAIFKYIDRIFGMVRPRKLLYMAIDGVAPRAKMNQQRSRRFRSAKEAADAEAKEEEVRRAYIASGRKLPPKKRKPWDSNVITPGTPFMAKVSKALHYYVAQRLDSDPGWKNIKVVFSDAKVPGEGEHKIMQYIRLQRAQPNYDPNLRHCLYGMDADLIMLGLATHEAHFHIIREMVLMPNNRNCYICGQPGHIASECTGSAAEKEHKPRPFQFLHISVLREYLQYELRILSPMPFKYDLERVLDDWVFLCFFVGNDFLPHLPSLEIREGAIDKLVNIYKESLPALGGYLTKNGDVNLSRVDVIMDKIGRLEDAIFRKRKARERRNAERNRHRAAANEAAKQRRAMGQTNAKRQTAQYKQINLQPLGRPGSGSASVRTATGGPLPSGSPPVHPPVPAAVDNKAAAQRIKELLKGKKKKKKKKEEEDTAVVKEEEKATEPTSSAQGQGDEPTQSELSVKTQDDDPTESVSSAKKRKRPLEDAADNGGTDSAEVAKEEPSTAAPPDTSMAPPATPTSSSPPAAAMEVDADTGTAAADSKCDEEVEAPGGAKRLKVDTAAAADVDTEVVDSVPTPLSSPDVLFSEEDDTPVPSPVVSSLKLSADDRVAYDKEVKAARKKAQEVAPQEDRIKLGEQGWKQRYYMSKLHIDQANKKDQAEFDNLYKSYAEGLCWVMHYYYKGVASWDWFYPYHYAPMSSDLAHMSRYAIKFTLSKPFSPISQLMAVLPASSGHCLPPKCRALMEDEDSPLKEFYPENFKVDLNGKKYLWQAVALLPWIDEKLLLTELEKVAPSFTEEERYRDSKGADYLFVRNTHGVASHMCSLYLKVAQELKKDVHELPEAEAWERKEELEPEETGGMFGMIAPSPSGILPSSPMKTFLPGCPVIHPMVVSSVYYDPEYATHHSVILPGAKLPAPVLNQADYLSMDRYARRGQGGTSTSFHRELIGHHGQVQNDRGRFYGGGHGPPLLGRGAPRMVQHHLPRGPPVGRVPYGNMTYRAGQPPVPPGGAGYRHSSRDNNTSQHYRQPDNRGYQPHRSHYSTGGGGGGGGGYRDQSRQRHSDYNRRPSGDRYSGGGGGGGYRSDDRRGGYGHSSQSSHSRHQPYRRDDRSAYPRHSNQHYHNSASSYAPQAQHSSHNAPPAPARGNFDFFALSSSAQHSLASPPPNPASRRPPSSGYSHRQAHHDRRRC